MAGTARGYQATMAEPKPPADEEFHEETPQEFAEQPDRDFAKVPVGQPPQDKNADDEPDDDTESDTAGEGER